MQKLRCIIFLVIFVHFDLIWQAVIVRQYSG